MVLARVLLGKAVWGILVDPKQPTGSTATAAASFPFQEDYRVRLAVKSPSCSRHFFKVRPHTTKM